MTDYHKFEKNSDVVQIFDTTNRDGEQATDGALNGVASKLRVARALERAGVDRIEMGFPSSSPGDFEAVQKASREIENSMIFSLTPIPKDPRHPDFSAIDQTFEAIKDANYRGIHTFSVTIEPNALSKYGYPIEDVFRSAELGVARARELLGDKGQVEFSYQNAFLAPIDLVLEGYSRVIDAGANVINIPDTTGESYHTHITDVIEKIRKEVPIETLISVHIHDDFGRATINSLEAVRAGADIVEGTITGVGERAGNTALEEVIANLKLQPEHFGYKDVRFDTTQINPIARIIEDEYAIPRSVYKAVIGSNAMQHRSGVHQDGVVKTKGDAYEPIKPNLVGWEGNQFELTARSGKAGVHSRLNELGYEITPDDVRRDIMPAFNEIADRKRRVEDEDLVVLMNRNYGVEGPYAYVSHEIDKTKDKEEYTAGVVIKSPNETLRGAGYSNGSASKHTSSTRSGSISALFSAVEQTIPLEATLTNYSIDNIGESSESLAEVTVVLKENPNLEEIRPFEGTYVGRAIGQDVLETSVRAYIDALNTAKK